MPCVVNFSFGRSLVCVISTILLTNAWINFADEVVACRSLDVSDL